MTPLVLALLLSQARVQTPTLSPAAGTYSSAQTVTATTKTPGATLFCTTNGASPVSAGTRYTGPISVAASGSVACYARRNGYRPSLTSSAAYTISSGPDCATAALRGTGTTYYYCDCQANADPACVAGSDANAGTSPSAPRQSLANAWSRFTGMNAGDTVALCRGGAWAYGGGSLENTRCAAASTCDLRDYVPSWGSASTARPRIAASGTILSLTSSTPSKGYRFWNLDLRMSGTSGSQAFFYLDKRNIDVCNVRFEGGNLHMNVDSGGTATSADSGIVIRNSQFYTSAFSAIYGGYSGMVIDGNYFENNGINNTPQMHSIYLNGITPGVYNAKVINNDFTTDARCGGVMLVVHERIIGAVVDNNRLVTTSNNANCYGIQSAGSAASAQLNDSFFRRNRVTTPGPGAGIEVSACTGCVVSDNVVVNGGMFLGTTYGGNTPVSSGFTVQNNTMYQGAITFGATVTGIVYDNNATWNTSGACLTTNGAGFTRNGNNYCRTGSGASLASVFVNAAIGDFRPAVGSPLIGAGSSTNYSPTAIGSTAWSASDSGVSRTPPVDAGAFVH